MPVSKELFDVGQAQVFHAGTHRAGVCWAH